MTEEKLMEKIKDITREAGEIMLTAVHPKVMEKGGHANFVTETDEKIQAFLIENLKTVLPDAAFLGEEDGQDVFTEKMSSGYCFVIDPIDGTSNFLYSYRPSVISVGLLKDGKPYMGVIYNPFENMMLHAVSGQGAFSNGEKITSSESPLSESLALFGTSPYYDGFRDRTFALAKDLLPLCVDLRRSGSPWAGAACILNCGSSSGITPQPPSSRQKPDVLSQTLREILLRGMVPPR